MALETGTYTSDLVSTNPTSSDPKSQGDDHIRLIKSTVKATLPNLTGAMTSSHTELNILDGATLSTSELNILDGVTSSAAELNILDGATLDVTELNRLDGITGPAAAKDGETYTGAHNFTGAVTTAATQTAGDATTKVATTAFVSATSFSTNLPGQTSNDFKVLSTDGANAGWYSYLKSTIMRWADGTDISKLLALDISLFTTGTTRTLKVRDENITIAGATTTDALKIYDYTDATKIGKLQISGNTTGTTRVYTLPDNNATLDTPGWRLLSVVTASNSATADIETTFDSTYDKYVIEVDGLTCQTNNTDLHVRLKIGGSYLATNQYNYHSLRLAVTVTPVTAQAHIAIVTGLSNASTASANMRMTIANPQSTAFSKNIHYDGVIDDSSNTACHFVGGGGTIASANQALTGVRFYMSSGNIVAGSFKLYGLRKSI